MQKLLLLSGIAFLSLTSISLSPQPAIAGCGLFDITCKPSNWTCPPGGCVEESTAECQSLECQGRGRPSSSVPDSGTSTYQNSCNNISISGNSLSANCRSSNGQFIQSSVNLKGIENINGVLSVTSSDRPSNFQLSCNSISIRRNVLSATCKTSNGNLNQTSISLNGIENIDGILKYTSNP